MKQFLNKFVYLHIIVDDKHFYYTKALILEITDTHITFNDDYGNPCTKRIADISEIKLSNKVSTEQ